MKTIILIEPWIILDVDYDDCDDYDDDDHGVVLINGISHIYSPDTSIGGAF